MGLALCSLHHKIFDLGAFTVLPGNHQIVFSRHLMGGDDTKAELLAHHGAGLIQPQGRECLPQPEFLAWHRAEVFNEPAREERRKLPRTAVMGHGGGRIYKH